MLGPDGAGFHQYNTNNYLTNDDDLQVATDGYKTRARVCHFFLNQGQCWKGIYCTDLHQKPREGAVTTDQEQVLVFTRELQLTRSSATHRVLLLHVTSPSCFYLCFPDGTRDVRSLSSSDLTCEFSPRYKTFQENLTNFYEKSPKRFLLSSLPAPGTQMVVKVNRTWYRARVLLPDIEMDEYSYDDTRQNVFFVDKGSNETVYLKDMR